MSPAHKILLSPQALSALSQNMPMQSGPPSFGEASSMASSSPCIPAMTSAPITPDLHNLVPVEGEIWGPTNDRMTMNTPLEIAVDEHHSIVLSPREAHSMSNRVSKDYSTDWSEMVTRFPEVPGGTPQEFTPISPNVDRIRKFQKEASDNGVQLPTDAMKLLQTLTRSYSPDTDSQQSGTSRAKYEMKERSDAGDGTRSELESTPTPSDSDFSQLSIPSPGGFFSSLQASSRATWCLPAQSRVPSMPSSATAANFYDLPFMPTSKTVETIFEVPDSAVTDGPPTARQPDFAIPAEYRSNVQADEDDDMYGAYGQVPMTTLKSSSPDLGHEYEDNYHDGLKQQAVASIDRTSNWLSAQNTYLSALRESNPMNDPAEYIPQTPHVTQDDNEQQEESPARKAVRFLEEAIKLSDTGASDPKKPAREPRSGDPVFYEAFNYCLAQKGRQDVFFQAAARLERINTTRLALPVQHIHSLLNTHTTETLQMHARPKYRGPFSQNPRATGNFQRSPEQLVYAEAERKQLAMDHISPAVWVVEAQKKVLYKERLFACPATSSCLGRSSDSTKKKLRVLDLAGAATGSWAWAAAHAWPNVSFITVQTKAQSQPASRWPSPEKSENRKVVKPTNPANHRVLGVTELWKLPFADCHFDIISARTLHMFIRSCPVPEVPSINEWDLVLKECMRVLKPGGIFDYVLLDSHILNNSTDNRSKHCRENSTETAASISPTAAYGQGQGPSSPPNSSTFGPTGTLLEPASLNFGRGLERRGYDEDGGCAKLAGRLEATGFVDHKSQWVGLPLGCTGPTHENVIASYERFEARAPTPASTISKATSTGVQRSKVGSLNHANGRSRTPFPPAPRPISEVSSISRIIEQYANVEAVQGPVGSTADVSDVAGLLGTMMWEEWLVRHRLEIVNSEARQTNDSKGPLDATYEATNLLNGINDVLAAGYAKGACFRVVVGWARKPGRKPASTKPVAVSSTAAVAAPQKPQQQQEKQTQRPKRQELPPAPTQPPQQQSQRKHQRSQPAIRINTATTTPGPRPQLIAHSIRPRSNSQLSSTTITTPSTLEPYRSRAQARALQNPSYEGYPTAFDETPMTANTADTITPRAYRPGSLTSYHAKQTGIAAGNGKGRGGTQLTLDTRSSGVIVSPTYTQSAVERGEVGVIPMMIIE